MTIEEFHDDIVSVPGFWNVGIVEETVEKTLPDMELRIDSQSDQSRVCIHSRTHFERPRPGDDQCWRKLREHFWRIDGGNQRVLGISIAEIAQPAHATLAHLCHEPGFSQRSGSVGRIPAELSRRCTEHTDRARPRQIMLLKPGN